MIAVNEASESGSMRAWRTDKSRSYRAVLDNAKRVGIGCGGFTAPRSTEATSKTKQVGTLRWGEVESDELSQLLTLCQS